jgi:thioredoxin 1
MLALVLALPADSLVVRLQPVAGLVHQAESSLAAGATDSATGFAGKAGEQWSVTLAGLVQDTARLPDGWSEGSVLASDRIATAETLLVAGRVADAARVVRSLSDLLYWLPRSKPTLLRFLGYRCESCLAMDKVLAKVAASYAGRVVLRTIDINLDEATARHYRITVVPTLVFLDPAGRESSRAAREMTEAEIGVRLDAMLKRD